MTMLRQARISDCRNTRTVRFMQPMKARWCFKVWMVISFPRRMDSCLFAHCNRSRDLRNLESNICQIKHQIIINE